VLEELFGNATAEKVLLYIEHYGDGYAKAIADTFGISLHMVQRQLARFERAGLLVNVTQGRTRVFLWNPRYAFLAEVRAVLAKALRHLPDAERRKYFSARRRGLDLLEQIGGDAVRDIAERRTPEGTLRLLPPTECVMDRLAAYYYFDDPQGCDQAIQVARAQSVDLHKVERWSRREGQLAKHAEFVRRLQL